MMATCAKARPAVKFANKNPNGGGTVNAWISTESVSDYNTQVAESNI